MKRTFAYDELPEVARQFWENFHTSQVFALDGDMGAGKTTLVKELCAAKGVEDATASPTFSIINEYRFKDGAEEKIIFHLDLYRLRSLEEAIGTGVEDCLYHPNAICFVEWPDIIEPLLPADTIYVFISVTPDQKRQIVAGSAQPGDFTPSPQ